MQDDRWIKIERHKMLADAHMIIVQSLKYAGTVPKETVERAFETIRAICTVEHFCGRKCG